MFEGLRWIVGLAGVLFVLGGLVAIVAGVQSAGGGLWMVALGCVGIVVALLERVRYRPDEARPLAAAAGRFEPTDEVFVDPTTGQRTRVFLDRTSGERRYEPER
jgi:hypothetical protein